MHEKSPKDSLLTGLLNVILMLVFCSQPADSNFGVISEMAGSSVHIGRIKISFASFRSLTVIL